MTATLVSPPAAGPWIPFGVPPGDMRLYCLPHAGGSASAYRAWTGHLGPVAVCAVQPPGRESRLGEAPIDRMEPLVAELADLVLDAPPGPYAVYGHSLGALVGFELVREIRRRGGPAPEHLLVSGSPAPHLSTGVTGSGRVADMTDAEVVELLRALGGTPAHFLADPSVLRMILPPIRADFGVKDTYRYEPGPPLDVPVTALAATADPRGGPADMAAWRDLTLRRFTPHTIAGGHFAVLEDPRTTQALIRAALSRP